MAEKNFTLDLRSMEQLIYPSLRNDLYSTLIRAFSEFSAANGINFLELEIPASKCKMPLIYAPKRDPAAPLILVLCGQHNEYNGTFGLLHAFSRSLGTDLNEFRAATKGGFCLVPLFNPSGFLFPKKATKWGYYVNGRNGVSDTTKEGQESLGKTSKISRSNSILNTNRHWIKTLNFKKFQKYKDKIPRENRVFGEFFHKVLQPSGSEPSPPLVILDFHESSLPGRYIRELGRNYSEDYPLNHWIKKMIRDTALKQVFGKLPPYRNHSYVEDVRSCCKQLEKQLSSKSYCFFAYGRNSGRFAKKLDQVIKEKYSNKLLPLYQSARYHPYAVTGSTISASLKHPRLRTVIVEMRKPLFNLAGIQREIEASSRVMDNLLHIMRINQEISAEIIFSLIRETQEYKFWAVE